MLVGGRVELGGEGLPFMPLADALRSLLRVTPPDELDEFLGLARLQLARLVPELDPDTAPSPAPGGDGGTARLLELALGVIQRLATDRRLMFVIEDLHWADRSTLDLVTLLVRALRGVRVLLVVTFRSDEIHRTHPLRPLVTNWDACAPSGTSSSTASPPRRSPGSSRRSSGRRPRGAWRLWCTTAPRTRSWWRRSWARSRAARTRTSCR